MPTPKPVCALSVQIYDDGNWNFVYTAVDHQDGEAPVTLSQWVLPLTNLAFLAARDGSTAVPTVSEREAAQAANDPDIIPSGPVGES